VPESPEGVLEMPPGSPPQGRLFSDASGAVDALPTSLAVAGEAETEISGEFLWVSVNEVTWKLTDGEGTNVPGSHGQWGGYRTARALAWVVNIGPGAWLARYRDRACKPSSLNAAKARALAMVNREIAGYVVKEPIAHLNGLQARLFEKAPTAKTKLARTASPDWRLHRNSVRPEMPQASCRGARR
jgi:hypothetical protein